jgi:hypothetical protein
MVGGLYVADVEVVLVYDYDGFDADVTDARLCGWKRSEDGRDYARGDDGKAITYRTSVPSWMDASLDAWCKANNQRLRYHAEDERQSWGSAAE